ncbi:MAG: YerC/YecD family TrpR-related protein [Patescibacteria group bacterium]|nr:YerC/YecD family TrpR-related protein [Patescibacteria group bacterium]
MKNKKNFYHWVNKEIDDLFSVILMLENLDEARRFFRDLLTKKEIIEFAKRWKAVQMLAQGITYKEIEKKTKMSSTTIARINRWLRSEYGGYRLILNKLNKFKDKIN